MPDPTDYTVMIKGVSCEDDGYSYTIEKFENEQTCHCPDCGQNAVHTPYGYVPGHFVCKCGSHWTCKDESHRYIPAPPRKDRRKPEIKVCLRTFSRAAFYQG
jgi:transposase-like protein